jgi:hypothetical protein
MCPPLRPDLFAALLHHACMTNQGSDPASLLRLAYRLRGSIGSGREAEWRDLVADLKAKAKAKAD